MPKKNRWLVYLIVLFILAASFIFLYPGSQITGLFIADDLVAHDVRLAQTLDQPKQIPLQIDDVGVLKSVRLYGSWVGAGDFEVNIVSGAQKYLLLDSTNLDDSLS